MRSWTVLISLHLVAAVWGAAVPRSTKPDIARTKLVREVVDLISRHRATTSQQQGLSEMTGLKFNPRLATTCLMLALHRFHDSLSNGNTRDMRLAVCGIADQYEICIAPYKIRCSTQGKMAFDSVIKGAKYLCTKEGYTNYLELLPCLSDIQVLYNLKYCAQRISRQSSNFCTLFDNYTSCAAAAVHTICTEEAEVRMKESLEVLLSPMRESACLVKTPLARSPITHQKLLSRSRRQLEGMGSLFGGGSEELAGGLQMSPLEFAWGEMPEAPQLPSSEFAWGDVAGMLPEYTMPEMPLGGETINSPEQAIPEISWENFQTFSHLPGQGISSEEAPTMLPDVTTQEPGSEEVVTTSPDVTTPETSSEEVSSAPPDVTTPEESSEEVSTASPNVTTPETSSEEVSTASQNATTPETSSEEVSTTSPDVTTPESSSEEVSASPNVTTPESSSEEVSTTSPDVTTPESSSEEVSASPNATTPESSSEEVSGSPNATTPEPSSEESEASTTAVPTPKVPTTELGPATITTLSIPSTTPIIINPDVTFPILTPAVVPETIPTTTASYKVPPFQCYECHSGAHGDWQNPLCPPNGQISGWAALPTVCYGQCVSVVTKYPKGEVYRSCSTNYYFPFQVPYDGCVKHNHEFFCFCSGDLCNNRDMIPEMKAYILESLIA